MRVEVRLFANLTAYLPGGGCGSATTLAVPDGATVGEVLALLAIPAELPRLLLVNGRDVEPQHRLVAGDVVSVLPPLVGGRA